ncbi:MAG: PhzF family phenazine biosynthesis protein [Blastocatellia bacterium]
MTKQRFIIADVFTEKQFGGNQLAVFTDARGLDAETMQEIAREMHFSETTFLFPPESGGDYRVRIFTPETELPFAGHPLVGTGYVIVAERMKQWSAPTTRVTLEAGVGPITVEINTENQRAGHTVMTQPLPVVKGSLDDVTALAKALSLEPADIESTGLPVEAFYNGITVMVVPVASLGAVERIKPDTGALERISDEMGAQTVLVFTRETVTESGTVHCRVFAPAAGVVEDAATGSANGPLGYYLVRHHIVEVEAVTRVLSEQGFEMHRPSLLHIEVDVDPSTNEVAGVRVGGGVVISGRGEIFLS